ncbi:putative metal-dependent hydrolase [Mycobacteroides salmoniphilum]|uniref:Putative metal-dependent hydrolase n=1 Tax=Mycobacteroides salmoniphilum TaxID=404941 RepID=A0A4R8S9G4_9MYCO|nr:metal-dependent hydrolase [Mycobacteroides salmoniphilum]TDZ77556.1 putative metal-dependent hydrolase [Mycobacteroides salmoniphilum]TDZ85731.1 putative metal-dependent hydrolase [Mycobacteroides salmoniphilum]TDZ86219.1 putative metal-dependent hydrolase [Mycobacteroides salmoniphilum]
MTSIHEPQDITIRARNVSFDLSDTPLHWIPNEPAASNTLSVLHIMVPEGERWFCEAFAEALPYVKDEKLAHDMRGFIGQEAMHAEVHDKAVGEFLEARGINTAPYLRHAEYLFRKVLAPKQTRSTRVRYNDLIQRLWLIAAIEHYTAVLGDFALNATWTEHGADPTMTDILRWHGAEEMEHRSVAHDVANYFHASYFQRCRAMILSIIGLSVLVHRGALLILREDPSINYSYPRVWIEYFRAARRGLLPKLGFLVTSTLSYFRPNFHPEEVGSTAQAVAYLAASPGARSAAL